MCSGQHSVSILLSKLKGWDPTDYWREDHPSQVAYREVVARAFGTTPERLRTAIDGCGVLTYAFPLREVARAYALLADPSAVAAKDSAGLARAGADDRPRRDDGQPGDGRRHPRPARHLADEGAPRPAREQERHGGAARAGDPARRRGRRAPTSGATGMAIKIEDGDGYDRGTWAASVEALVQAGVLDGQALRVLARYHRPAIHDPHGRLGAEAIPSFDLAPLGELLGRG